MKIKTFRFTESSRAYREQNELAITFDEDDKIVNSFIADKDVIDIKINIYTTTSLISPEVREVRENREIGSRMMTHRAFREITILYNEKTSYCGEER